MIKEASAINQSLSCLQDVMKKLANNELNIVYRSNKLTHFMSDSLGGNSKSLMIININPHTSGSFETQSSLVYASKVKNIKNNVFKVHENKQIRYLKYTIDELENELDMYKNKGGGELKEENDDKDLNSTLVSRSGSVDNIGIKDRKLVKNTSFSIDNKNKRE
mmetsp:Transcript_11890/g.10144  ORF Transcript_11890/g.10144 Transcript_11890/m.10144 type:complete len:163 (-) Transcript_11890:102-590(-)